MRRLLLAAGAVAILVAISGCDAADPRVTPAPTPSATPVFASDEEALAAAEAAYAAYLSALDTAFSTYDLGPLTQVAAGEALDEARDSVASFQNQGLVLVGSSAIRSVSLIDYSPSGDVEAYACLDVSETDVLNAQGQSTVQPDRPALYPMQISVTLDASSTKIESEEVWDGENFCI